MGMRRGARVSKANPTGGLSPGLGGRTFPASLNSDHRMCPGASSCLSWPQFPDCLRRAGHRIA